MQSCLGSHAGVSKYTDNKTNLSVFVDTHAAAANPETKSLSAFRKDNHARKVYLLGRGE